MFAVLVVRGTVVHGRHHPLFGEIKTTRIIWAKKTKNGNIRQNISQEKIGLIDSQKETSNNKEMAGNMVWNCDCFAARGSEFN